MEFSALKQKQINQENILIFSIFFCLKKNKEKKIYDFQSSLFFSILDYKPLRIIFFICFTNYLFIFKFNSIKNPSEIHFIIFKLGSFKEFLIPIFKLKSSFGKRNDFFMLSIIIFRTTLLFTYLISTLKVSYNFSNSLRCSTNEKGTMSA